MATFFFLDLIVWIPRLADVIQAALGRSKKGSVDVVGERSPPLHEQFLDVLRQVAARWLGQESGAPSQKQWVRAGPPRTQSRCVEVRFEPGSNVVHSWRLSRLKRGVDENVLKCMSDYAINRFVNGSFSICGFSDLEQSQNLINTKPLKLKPTCRPTVEGDHTCDVPSIDACCHSRY